MTLRETRDAKVHPASLTARFIAGPHLSDSDKATQRLSDWLSDLATDQATEFEGLFARVPFARQIFAGVAEASPYLFE
ncbi:MAG: hypothetical protein WAM83_08425, partial [Bradyrhizobium sp.]